MARARQQPAPASNLDELVGLMKMANCLVFVNHRPYARRKRECGCRPQTRVRTNCIRLNAPENQQDYNDAEDES